MPFPLVRSHSLCTTCIQALIAKGSLQSDDLARALVPLLLRKASRVQRGCQRAGGRAGPCAPDISAGMHELGFLLGGCLNSPEVCKSFGISRQVAKAYKCALVSDFLPQFFGCVGDKFTESIKVALDIIQRDPRRKPYMAVRDEVVYSRTFNVIYGLSFLVIDLDDWAVLQRQHLVLDGLWSLLFLVSPNMQVILVGSCWHLTLFNQNFPYSADIHGHSLNYLNIPRFY